MAKVSVIVPVYGVEKYIERCARSLFEQTLDDIEYVFINDCTTDKSISILRRTIDQYPLRKPYVKIINLEKNLGQAFARKIGIEQCCGDYVIHCDSDDWIEKSMYEKLYNHAVQYNCDIVRCNFYRELRNKTRISKKISSSDYGNKYKIMSKMMIGYELTSLVDKLVRKEIVKSDKIIWPECNMQEDHVLVLQYVYYSTKIGYIDMTAYHYCYNPTSTTKLSNEIDYLNRFKQVYSNTQKIEYFLNSVGIESKFKTELICQKFRVRCALNKLLSHDKYINLWMKAYPEIDKIILLSLNIPFKIKCLYIICILTIIKKRILNE